MTASRTPQSLLVEHLDHVHCVVRCMGRRIRLSPDEAEECVSWVQVRLVEDDCALLRKCRGESSFRSFVAVVVAMLVRDYRVRLHGRWRPSARARRLGPFAIRLERLIDRDGMPVRQAVLVLHVSSQGAATERALRDLVVQLPRRRPLRPHVVGVVASAHEPARERADRALDEEERTLHGARIAGALRAELASLPAEDREALELDVVQGRTVAEIARCTGAKQRTLYHRLMWLRRSLRTRLEAAGISPDHIRALLEAEED